MGSTRKGEGKTDLCHVVGAFESDALVRKHRLHPALVRRAHTTKDAHMKQTMEQTNGSRLYPALVRRAHTTHGENGASSEDRPRGGRHRLVGVVRVSVLDLRAEGGGEGGREGLAQVVRVLESLSSQ